jgi:hypothetical protein
MHNSRFIENLFTRRTRQSLSGWLGFAIAVAFGASGVGFFSVWAALILAVVW